MITVEDRVKVLQEIDGKASVQYEKGTVLYIGRRALVQFDINICGHNGNGLGKDRHCWMCDFGKIQRLGE